MDGKSKETNNTKPVEEEKTTTKEESPKSTPETQPTKPEAEAKSEAETKTESKSDTKPETKPAEPTQEKPTEKTQKTSEKLKAYLTDNTKLPLLIISTLALIIACIALFLAATNNKSITLSSGTDGNSANFTEGSIADVANQVSKGVVSIVTETRTASYFGQSSTSSAAGTGMIVSSDGYVLTNKHVVSDATAINVVLEDGTTYDDVTVAATDNLSDVAFLKIANVSNLKPVTLGDSKTLSVGQQVIAIGNALGQYQNTVTSGIISGLGRSVTATDSSYSTSETLNDMIQTDAAINAGNSGGPLVNAAGQVIGINTATSTANDIGFAIPISSVKGMLNQLLANGTASRAYIGVYYVNITPEVAKEYNLSVSSGAYIYNQNSTAVISNGPAAKAGLKDGDIITKVNGSAVGTSGSLSSLVGEYQPGETIRLTIIRDGKEQTLDVTLDAYKSTTTK